MKRMRVDEDGSLALITILLLPTILIVLVGVLELGVVRVVAERARIAADLATVTAVNDQDDAELRRTGGLRPSADAASVAREHFTLGLDLIAPILADAPAAISASADVSVFATAGAVDPVTGRAYPGPTVRLSVDVPVRTPVFAALLGRPVTAIRIVSASSAR